MSFTKTDGPLELSDEKIGKEIGKEINESPFLVTQWVRGVRPVMVKPSSIQKT